MLAPRTRFTCAIGIGGIGAGILYALEGDHNLGRNESRLGELRDARDYCKLHIVEHYIARLMGSSREADSFQVWPIGVVGNDAMGTQILAEMKDAGLDVQFVRVHPILKTLFSVCFIYPDSSGGNITSNNSAAGTLNVDDLKNAVPKMKAAGERGVALCLPEVPLQIRKSFLQLASDCGNYRVCSFALGEIEQAKKMGMFSLADLVTLNQEEASALVGDGRQRVLDERILVEGGTKLTATRPGLRMVVSAGQKGAYAFESGRLQLCPAPVLQVISTAGAGDALLAGVVSGLASGMPFLLPDESASLFSGRKLYSALDLGVLIASFSVCSPHSIHPDATLENLLTFAESRGANVAFIRSKFLGCDELP